MINNNTWLQICTMVSLLCLVAGNVNAQVPDQELTYDIKSEGDKIGSFSVTISAEDGAVKTSIKAKIKVKKMFITLFSLESEEEFLQDERGVYSYQSRAKIDGEKINIAGKLVEDIFEFNILYNKKSQKLNFPVNSYDYTSAGSPEKNLTQVGETKTFRMLDFENLQIRKISYKYLKNESLRIGKSTVECKVIEFSSIGNVAKGTYWISDDKDSILIREKGVDEDGDYEVVLVKR